MMVIQHSSLSQTIDILLNWCADNDILIDPRLQVRGDDDGAIGVYSNDICVIDPGTSLVHIRKSSVLSARSCCLSEYMPHIFSGPESQLTLSLALYTEMLNARSSRWFGYLQSLPSHTVDLPLFWGHGSSMDDTSHDRDAALKWLKGTEVERCLQRQPGLSLEAINSYYTDVAEPLIKQRGLSSIPNLKGFHRAFSLVSSRAFLVDAYHGLSMVPIADAFNHSLENQVHLETEFNVCSQCGSFEECPHDDDDDSGDPSSKNIHSPVNLHAMPRQDTIHSGLMDFDAYYEMVSNAPILPGSEVFNTYGETLTNAQLLCQYGFVVSFNENDHISWDLADVYQSFTNTSVKHSLTLSGLEAGYATVLRNLVFHGVFARLSESSLVYRHSEAPHSDLCLDGDGKISHQLWVALAFPFCVEGNGDNSSQESFDVISVLDKLKALFELQLAVEWQVEIGVASGDSSRRHCGNPTASRLVRLAELVISLCSQRKNSLGAHVSGHAAELDLNAILDAVPHDMHRTRDILNMVITERSILDSCESSWKELSAAVFL
ncbi:Ribosomal lysine N-methyltransferase 3 [Hypsizygus marmoreus]|uniref:Ribosomal lysine N-methyltransferase 3 n=1 Tax=Hypsizygus marmoreus TaxID=39966 RepID=A0A369JYG7_HYPMA|nr:Ribosomal lysine N-methyltransferase 3 [Hypsizygus marmoreus]